MDEKEAEEEKRPRYVRIPVPIAKCAGLGDVVKRLTAAAGVRACGGCQRRAETLNRWVGFSPWGKKRRG